MTDLDGQAAASRPLGDEIAPKSTEGTSRLYADKKRLRRYTVSYSLASAAFVLVVGSSNILLSNQIQGMEFGQFFTGPNSGVDLQSLTQLRDAIAAGTARATAEQVQQLGLLTRFEASRANGLAVVTSLALIATLFLQPIVGVLSDRTRSRFGRRAPWILWGAIVGCAGLIAVPFAPSIAVLAILWIVVQTGLAASQGPLAATVADRVDETRRGGVSAAVGLGNFLGGILGAIAVGVTFSFIGLYLFVVWAALIVLLVVLFLLRNRDQPSTELQVPSFRWSAFWKGFLVPLRARDFRWVWIARVLLTFGFGMSTALGLYMLQSYVRPALSAAEATSLSPLIAVAGVPFTLVAVVLGGRLSDRWGRRKPFVIGSSILMALSMAVPLISPSVPGLFVQAILASVAFGIFLPVDQALFIDVLPEKAAAGRDLGIAIVATNLGTALAPLLASQVVAVTGGYQFVWVFALLLTGLAAVSILRVKGAR